MHRRTSLLFLIFGGGNFVVGGHLWLHWYGLIKKSLKVWLCLNMWFSRSNNKSSYVQSNLIGISLRNATVN